MHVVSTAGHVDHGKSALIACLTGIDPDRLAEEKARGLTIDLGFAWLTLPSDREIGIVDVPGHERFIHNMLAGVGSVDSVIFIVAANEGWRPQSEEHLAILDLLGARNGVVALTKMDLVDDVAAEKARAHVVARMATTTLAASEIVGVSAHTGAGIPTLLDAIDRMLDRVGEPPDIGRPRVFVDRSFSIKGAGTVVTGTLTGGTLEVEQTVEIAPRGGRARVRGIESHKRQARAAKPTARVALNLAGIDRNEVARGDAIVLPGQWRASTELDVHLRVVRTLDYPLTNRGAYKAYIGSAEIDARVSLHDTARAAPGAEAFARLTLAAPAVAAPLDHFILRDTGRRATVAGGLILDPHPVRAPRPHARRDPASGPPRAPRPHARLDPTRGTARAHASEATANDRVAQLRARLTSQPDQMAARAIDERGVVARADLAWLAGTTVEPSQARALPSYLLSQTHFAHLAAAIEDPLKEFHARQPLAAGMPREDARLASGFADARLFTELLAAIHTVVADGATLRLATHAVVLSTEQDAARAALLQEMNAMPFAPPGLADLRARYGEPLVRALADAGTIVRIAGDIAFTATQLDEARATIAGGITREGPLTASRIRELLSTSRKYAIPLLEHLDAIGFTRRDGDVRTLR